MRKGRICSCHKFNKTNFLTYLMESIVKLLMKEFNLSYEQAEILLEVPPSEEMGDFAFPCFSLAKEQKRSPLEIAQEFAEKIRTELPEGVSNVDFKGAYVNFFIDKKMLAEKVFGKVFGVMFGSIDLAKGKTRLIEYSQPNTHKAFHIGHIRGTSLGESLARIFKACGEKVTQMNYSGDTGMHIAKWIWGYKNFHGDEELREDEKWIANIYVDSVRRLEGNEDGQREVEEINRKIESKEDEEINDLWKRTREASIMSWAKIYSELGANFDVSVFESEVEDEARKEAQALLEKGIAKKDDAIFMDLKKYDLGVWVLLRKDGSVLYSAKDIALAKRKFSKYKSDKYLITIGSEQEMHFRQLRKTLNLMGLEKESEKYEVLPFGMIRFPDGKMSSRTGNNILYSDFSSEVCRIAKDGLKSRGYKNDDIDEVALKIAIASIKYSMLKQAPRKNIIFDKNAEVSFEGDTGPYLLYSYARANSIIKKVQSDASLEIFDLKEQESKLLKKIDSFEDVLKRAYVDMAPNLIANYCLELCQMFNEFYHACPVLGSKEQGFRLKLVDAFRITLQKALDLLGIETVEEM